MFDRNRSGQFVYFSLASVFSGTPVTGIASGNISGRRCLDGGALTVCSGPVIEDGGGLYHLNAFDFDLNGNNVGFLFTASGCNVVAFTAVTAQNVSGKLFPNSGVAVGVLSGAVVGVFSGNLSGQLITAASGVFGTASLNSGQFVLVYSGQLSGQPAAAAVVNSGLFVTASLNSGQIVLVYSGQLSGQPTSPNSGAFTISSLNSGQRALPYSGQLSGQFMTPQSGTAFLGSGQLTQEVPQATLTWNFSGAPDVSGVRNLLNANRKLINKWSLADVSGYLRVYRENDTTVAYDQAATSTSGGESVTGLDT